MRCEVRGARNEGSAEVGDDARDLPGCRTRCRTTRPCRCCCRRRCTAAHLRRARRVTCRGLSGQQHIHSASVLGNCSRRLPEAKWAISDPALIACCKYLIGRLSDHAAALNIPERDMRCCTCAPVHIDQVALISFSVGLFHQSGKVLLAAAQRGRARRTRWTRASRRRLWGQRRRGASLRTCGLSGEGVLRDAGRGRRLRVDCRRRLKCESG